MSHREAHRVKEAVLHTACLSLVANICHALLQQPLFQQHW